MASSSPIPTLKLLNQTSISPPVGTIPETTIPLSFSDLMWLYMGSVERLFFYSLPSITTTHFMEHLLPSLKSSLSLTLPNFFPLAGHIIHSPTPTPNFHYHFSTTNSIPFTVAESDDDFKHLTGDDARSVLRLSPLVPPLSPPSGDAATPLMAVQVTVFPNHGVSIGLTINHGVCDGTSTANFMKLWADTCKSGSAAPFITPLFDRSLFIYPKELDSIYLDLAMKFRELISNSPIANNSNKSINNEAKQDDVVIGSFWLSKDEIEKLKQWISKENAAVTYCSTFVVACAYVWTCLVRARGWEISRTAWLSFAVNLRGRLQPPVPKEYFGNCLGVSVVTVEVGELVKDDGVSVAAGFIRRAIDELRDDALRYASRPEIGRTLGDMQPLTVAGSPAFRVYDRDFGWGRPVKVEVVSIGRNGAMSISEGRDGEGIGIGLAASKHEMDKFRLEFAKGLQEL
ncbi:Transferase protein [Dioscorea alata]|uniref:Transferase protein n=1 Tax=Dioscorea alata TaxID=55571 RepID=A0ACB7WU80_DIOAL|nr:Transferase protein [Dioscorea alata]